MATAKMSELEHQARFESMADAAAAGKAVFNKSIIQKNQKVTLGILWNTVKDQKELLVHDIHNWSGDLTEPYPNPLPYRQGDPQSTFVHQGSNGSKGGVVYVDGTDQNARMWLVAFDSPNNKCYVECGPIGPRPTDWNLIELKLNNSGNRSSFHDPVFGGRAFARVMPDPDSEDENRRLCVVDFVF